MTAYIVLSCLLLSAAACLCIYSFVQGNALRPQRQPIRIDQHPEQTQRRR